MKERKRTVQAMDVDTHQRSGQVASGGILVKIRDVVIPGDSRGTPGAAVGPISLDIYRGELLAIISNSSTALDTLLRMVAGVAAVRSGTIDRAVAPEGQPAERIGLVLPKPGLLPWRTVLGNILLQAEMHGLDRSECLGRARRLMAWFGLCEFEGRLPHELPFPTGQLVSLCRALAHNPPLLLLIEPFLQFDALAAERALDALQRLWKETEATVLLGTRNIQAAVLLANRIAIISAPPAPCLQVINIDLPYPRRFDRAMTPAISDCCGRIRTILRAQGALP